MAQIAKISSKGQVTVPAKVRQALHVKCGDMIAWNIDEQGRVTLQRVTPLDLDYLASVSGTLSEWSSREDEEDYGSL